MRFSITSGDGNSDAATIRFTGDSDEDQFLLDVMKGGTFELDVPLYRHEQAALRDLLDYVIRERES